MKRPTVCLLRPEAKYRLVKDKHYQTDSTPSDHVVCFVLATGSRWQHVERSEIIAVENLQQTLKGTEDGTDGRRRPRRFFGRTLCKSIGHDLLCKTIVHGRKLTQRSAR